MTIVPLLVVVRALTPFVHSREIADHAQAGEAAGREVGGPDRVVADDGAGGGDVAHHVLVGAGAGGAEPADDLTILVVQATPFE